MLKFTIDLEDITGNVTLKNTLLKILPQSVVDRIDDILEGLEFRIAKPIMDKKYKIIFETREENGKTLLAVDIPMEILGMPKVDEFIAQAKDRWIEKFMDKLNPNQN